ncbi:EAL domain-containing protein [Paracoccus sp. Z118]|uniref:EAL domain-containing protein n=1 Tax=Paracoccus sp. Z118 TaxID=2851017 RepID=UPI001C2CAF2E|nr:EAL domain-containing protein [Paracoccus sp. Z118]MBV0892862.1 EAL domain-containing protein [Paracoccus sp. Z118]
MDDVTSAPQGLHEFFCPNSILQEWLARQPPPEGFSLIVPDNLDMLEIAAGTSQMHHLRQQIEIKLGTVFGSHNVAKSGSMNGFLVALESRDPPICTAFMGQVLQEITGIQLDRGAHGYALTARAGVIWTDGVPTIAPELLRRKLVTALVAAQRNHRSCVAASLQEDSNLHETELTAKLLCDLPAAMRENRLRLNAQDIVVATDRPGTPQEVEILLVMEDREGRVYPPANFLPEAEKSVLIEMVDQWVLRRTLVGFGPQLRAYPQLWVSINVSAPSLGNPAFGDVLAGVLRESRIDPGRVQIEITETAVIRDLDQACTNIREARQLGCRIALDDFGSGMSSFSYLKAFAPDCIKIDGSLIPNVVDPEKVEAQVVRSIINLAHRLEIEVVAEHVSSPEILTAIRDLGIDKVQGYELGRPRPFSQLFAGR